MVDGNSSLVKESLIKVGMSGQDPFGQPYEGKSSKATYELKCAGDPNNQEDAGPIVRTPGQVTNSSPVSGPAAGTPKSDAPAAPGSKK